MNYLSRLRVRARLMIAILVPVLVTAVAATWVTTYQFERAGDAEIERLRGGLTAAHRVGLMHLVESVRSMIHDDYENPATHATVEEAKLSVRRKLRSVEFGDSNYIYAYRRDTFMLAFRPNPELEGLNKDWDEATLNLLDNLFAAGRGGGGFHAYEWRNPATGKVEPKLSYSITLDRWDWVIGAGVYLSEIDKAVAVARAEVQEQIERAQFIILIITLTIVAVVLAFGLLMVSSVTRPLNRVSAMMLSIAEGEGDLTRRLPAEGDDELAELSRRFNTFVGKLHNIIRELGETAWGVVSAARDLSTVASETRASVQAQKAETDQILLAINEMAVTIQQIAGNTCEVERAASNADELVQCGNTMIFNTQSCMTKLSHEISHSATGIRTLAEGARDVQQILDVIRSVTDQTNLLALNAAIEAARAGDNGRGFSVVADEVRQLAKRSAESAEQIRLMIEGYVTDSMTAVERMNTSSELSEVMAEHVGQTSDGLATIGQSVGRIHDQVTMIAAGAEQQSQVAEEIRNNVVRIVEFGQRSATCATRADDASHELARQGERLKTLISHFKV